MKVPFDKIEEAMQASSENINFWLDKKTGKVIFIGDEDVVGEAFYDDDEEAQAAHEIMILNGEIENEENIEIDASRYLEIIPPYSDEKWRWMEEFALAQQDNPKLFNKLAHALQGSKPFRRFKEALFDFPDKRENWFAFENKKLREFIQNWADDEGIELDFDQ
jgi:hypothetical protein